MILLLLNICVLIKKKKAGIFADRNNKALQMLRDLILVDFAEKLRAQAVEKEETKYLRSAEKSIY
jgi:hypothetical protein